MPRDRFTMRLYKYHALGNDYLVLDSEHQDPIAPAMIRQICDRHRGIGADGILVRVAPPADAPFQIRIYNPDGSEAEKSGNGLRIFACHLWDRGDVTDVPFKVATRGGSVTCRVHADGKTVTVDMGRVTFDSRRIPVAGTGREVLRETLELPGTGTRMEYSAASIGNPHCVILRDRITEAETRQWGPLIENAARFPHRTNVQFVQVISRNQIRLEIWERGAGYTLASGSSCCAAAAVAYRLGLADPEIEAHAPGGTLRIRIAPDYAVTMTGPVTRIGEVRLHPEFAPSDE